MNKADIADYLVSLHTLIDAQTKGAVSTASKTLGDEYESHWTKLKELIQKDQEDEARNRQQQSLSRKTADDSACGVTGGGVADRHPRGDIQGNGTVVQRSGV